MKRNYLPGMMLFLIVFLIGTGCKKDNATLSTVKTLPPLSIASTEATLAITVESDGGSHITDCGIYISASVNAEKTGQKFQFGSDTGSFVGQISGLIQDMQFYIKAYAKNDKGESLGSEINFLTPATIKDFDNNTYETVQIVSQTWMAQNLKTTSYNNGDPIGTTSTATADITGESTPKYQWAYNGDEANAGVYGRLYTGYAVTDSRGVCPTGWHLPSDAEWTILTAFLGSPDFAGGLLKERGTDHWASPNTGATNETLFSALPGGSRQYATSSFLELGTGCYFWSSTDLDLVDAWYEYISATSAQIGKIGSVKGAGFSVRCIKD